MYFTIVRIGFVSYLLWCENEDWSSIRLNIGCFNHSHMVHFSVNNMIPKHNQRLTSYHKSHFTIHSVHLVTSLKQFQVEEMKVAALKICP